MSPPPSVIAERPAFGRGHVRAQETPRELPHREPFEEPPHEPDRFRPERPPLQPVHPVSPGPAEIPTELPDL